MYLPNRTLSRLLPVALALFLVVPVFAQPFEQVSPEEAGFSSERLARLDAVLQGHIDREELAGVSALVLRDGQAVYQKAFGMADREAGRPMSETTLLRIASMSKAVTSVAAMILYEEGHFMLDDPIANFLPEFKEMQVAVPPAGGEALQTVPAARPITVRHLLTHTSGLTYGGGHVGRAYEEQNLVGWYFADRDETIGDAVKRIAQLPLAANPGDAYLYGLSTDVLGRLVEVVSGMPLDRFFAERIFEPLGMEDSFFYVPQEKADRLAAVYGREAGGKITLRESPQESAYLNGPRRFFGGGAGLVSTLVDYGRLLQMLLQGGELDGVRILSPKTVDLMTVNHIGDKHGPTRGFGLGFWVIEDLGKNGELGSVGAYGWGSAYYPQYWVDPAEGLVGIVMTQLMPSGNLQLNRRFVNLIYQAMTESRVEEAATLAR